MGRHVDVSHLTDDECRHILDVITKDFALRKTEHQRIRKLQRKLEEMKREVALKSSHSHNIFGDCCMLCGTNLLKFCCFVSRSKNCLSCQNEICPKCRWILKFNCQDHHLCLLCVKKREVKRKSAEWFYEEAERRFKHFGSSKALRAMHKQRDNVEPRVITLLTLMKDLSFAITPSTPRPLSALIDSAKQGSIHEPLSFEYNNKMRPRSRSSSEVMLSALNEQNSSHSKRRKISASNIEMGRDVLNDQQTYASTTKLKQILKTSETYQQSSATAEFHFKHPPSISDSETGDENKSFSSNVLTEVEFIGIALMTVALSLLLSFITCVGYIGEIHSESEEEDEKGI